MLWVEEPGSVSQYLIHLIEITQFLWNVAQTLEPHLIPALGKEFLLLQVDEIATLVTSGCLLRLQTVIERYSYK